MSFDPRTGQPHSAFGPDFRDPFGPPKAASGFKWLWLILGGGILMTCLCCGGGLGVVMFGFNIMTVEIKDQLRDNPKFREHIGETQEFEMDWAASFADQRQENDILRFKVRGDKGAGELTVKHRTDGGKEVVEDASLRLEDGRTVQIVP